MFTRVQMKQAGKLNFMKNWGSAVIAVLLFLLPGKILSIIDYSYEIINSGGIINYFSMYYYTDNEVYSPDMSTTPASTIINLISLVVFICITPVLTVGVHRYFLKLRGGLTPTGTETFSPFKEGAWGNIIAVNLIVYITILLWSLLFIIPGIYKIFQYSMVSPMLASNPNLNSSRAKQLSRMMMKDHCGELFVLYLSFFGWFILNSFTMGILDILYVRPYFQATIVEFYSCRRAELIQKGELNPAELPTYGTDWYSPYNPNGPFNTTNSNYGTDYSAPINNQYGFNPNIGNQPGYDPTAGSGQYGYTPPQSPTGQFDFDPNADNMYGTNPQTGNTENGYNISQYNPDRNISNQQNPSDSDIYGQESSRSQESDAKHPSPTQEPDSDDQDPPDSNPDNQ